jgi:Ser/Thr protein kinase RdoA (MazF antagonist)
MTDPAFDERFWLHYPPILRPIDRARRALHGFSGSVVWKAATEAGFVAVRRFPLQKTWQYSPLAPAFSDRPPFELDHAHLFRARIHGWTEVPQPLPNNDGQTFTKHDGAWWDVCTWQSGEPAQIPVDGPHLRAAMHLIARWHIYWTGEKSKELHSVDADAVQSRRTEWRRLWRRQWASPGGWSGTAEDPLGLSDRTARAVKARARRIESQLYELQTLFAAEPKVLCHGDLHREHVLFTDGKPTGLIDLSCRWDYAAADLARWLSTTTDMNRWAQAVEWYRERAPLSAASERAIPMLAETGLAIAALRWEKWLLGVDPERRYFPRPDLAYDRWRAVVERLEGGEV